MLSLLALLTSVASPAPAAVAVHFDRDGKVETRVTQGLSDRSSGRKITPDDPVRVASVSKLIVALGVLRLMEAGKLDLDRDVSDYLGWRLRHPAYPDRPISLAQLLGHRSGLNDDSDYALPLDADLETALRDPAAWDKARAPGGDFAYANFNYPVVAAVVEGVTGERFDKAMTRLVFRPLGLDACFNWPTCSNTAVARAVVLYDADGNVVRDELKGVRPPCPVVPAADGSCDVGTYRLARHGAGFSPQGGLRISANGLARIGVMLLRRGDSFLKPESLARLEAMAAVHPTSGEGTGGFFCEYGIAMHSTGGPALHDPACRDDLFGDGRLRLGHSGDAYGLRSGLWFDLEGGEGIAYFVTQVPEGQKGTRSAYSAAEEVLVDAALRRTADASPLASPAHGH
ncbi:CubicO group peptidase (beta-lactamase class C family) [Sphingopyxis sp. OAS728]|uniref:serine hydrolase domain-containing protein n=1 Tax=Sphingopyxis sp. OAS728 TaxID=2663823 RepID=UPI00178A52B2|nr:serine hydrolase domain-containing protein [Sphingopyxis sp. OAS728]MBE1529438.1 CubicO group peptidase (beta-lactamase class C family) [Sphingopyxis sp. OAS728]